MLKTIIAGIIGGTMLWVGITKIGEGRQGKIVAYRSVDEIDPNGPKWIRIENCTLNLSESKYEKNALNENAKEAFVAIGSEKKNSLYFLQTDDPKLLKLVNELIRLDLSATTSRTALEMARQEPKYLDMLKMTEKEMEQKAEEAEKKLNDFVEKHHYITTSVQGMFNASFDVSEKDKQKLSGFGIPGSHVNIIKDRAKPENGLFPWFLSILGGLILIGCLAQLAGKRK